jgi:hypothetical protein
MFRHECSANELHYCVLDGYDSARLLHLGWSAIRQQGDVDSTRRDDCVSKLQAMWSSCEHFEHLCSPVESAPLATADDDADGSSWT